MQFCIILIIVFIRTIEKENISYDDSRGLWHTLAHVNMNKHTSAHTRTHTHTHTARQGVHFCKSLCLRERREGRIISHGKLWQGLIPAVSHWRHNLSIRVVNTRIKNISCCRKQTKTTTTTILMERALTTNQLRIKARKTSALSFIKMGQKAIASNCGFRGKR